MFFFFQAKDGIRDLYVTGVQTCALPIDRKSTRLNSSQAEDGIRDLYVTGVQTCALPIDRKSTRLNSSHVEISYAVFCLTKVQTCALRSEEHTSELQSRRALVCRHLLVIIRRQPRSTLFPYTTLFQSKSTRLSSSHVEIPYAVFYWTGVQTCAL